MIIVVPPGTPTKRAAVVRQSRPGNRYVINGIVQRILEIKKKREKYERIRLYSVAMVIELNLWESRFKDIATETMVKRRPQ